MLILRELRGSLLRLEFHRHDLRLKSPAVDSGFGALLRDQRVAVLLLARDAVLLGQHFGSFAHHHLRHGAEKAITIHAIDQLLMAKPVAPARAIEVIGQPRH